MGPIMPALPLGSLNSVCAAFQSDLDAGINVDLSDYLHQAADDVRASLLRNLLQIEMRYRRAAGQELSCEAYIERMPEYSDVIREEFEVATVVQASMLSDTCTFHAADGGGPHLSVTRLGDYLIGRELGRGAMGAVFAAIHVVHGTEVALKTLPTVSGRELQRFKNEFRALADVNHRNLIGLHTLQEDGGQWFFTMDLVDGEDFQSYVRPNGILDVARLRDALCQLAAGVQALHAHNVVHRDLKPSNVMVSRDGRVILLDFGVVLDLTSPGREDEAAGTPAYMAPEQFSERTTTTSSDWYAVGVMLYQALSGRLPFRGTIAEIYRAKQTNDLSPLPADVPEDLAVLCRRLLTPNVGQRPGLSEILSVLAPDDEVMPDFAGPHRERIAGRSKQIRQIDEAIQEFQQAGAARAVFISGRSGEGKTLLADHVLERFRRSDEYTVLSGRCYDRESVPFKAVDNLVDALSGLLRTFPDETVAELLTPDAAVLAALFPVLDRIPALANLTRTRLDEVEPERVRRLAGSALRDIFTRLSRKTTLILFIDDLQWGDADSTELLWHALSPPKSPRVLFLGTYRNDEAEGSRFLNAWNALTDRLGADLRQETCRLTPLDEAECIQLVVEVVGVDSESVRRRAKTIVEETGGNPFLLTELATCYRLDAGSSQPMQMDDVVERKLTQLPPDARALLDVVSVSGQALSLDEAAHTAGHEAVPLSTINRMRTERLVRLVGDEPSLFVDTYHDRIRETVLRDMEAARKKGLHVRLAEQILKSFPPVDSAASADQPTPRVFDLAYHFYEGGDRRAFDYQLQAGEAAVRVYALEDGLEYLKKAEETLPADADRATRFRLWERLGDASGRTRQVLQGLDYYQRAAPLAADVFERAIVQDGIGEMYHNMGELESAVSSFDEALRELGYRRARWLPRVLLDTAWNLTLCQMLPWLVRPCRSENDRRKADLAASVYHRIAQVLLTSDAWRYTDACAGQTRAALRSGNYDAIAISYSKLAVNNACLSLRYFAAWMNRRAESFAAETADNRTSAIIAFHRGSTVYHSGRIEESETLTRKALEVIEKNGDIWYCTMAHHFLRHIHSARGESQRAIQEAETEVRMGEAASDRQAICWGEYGLADSNARMGRLDEAVDHMKRCWAAIESGGGNLSKCIGLNHEGFVWLQCSDYERAIDVLEDSRRILEKNFVIMDFTVRTYPLLVESLIGPDWLQQRRDATIRRAKRVMWKTRLVGWRFPCQRPHALRVRGRLYGTLGKTRNAQSCFQKSIDFARELGAEYDLARGLLDLAAVSNDGGQSLRDEAVATLKRLKAVIPFAERWQLGDTPVEMCIAPKWPNNATST